VPFPWPQVAPVFGFIIFSDLGEESSGTRIIYVAMAEVESKKLSKSREEEEGGRVGKLPLFSTFYGHRDKRWTVRLNGATRVPPLL
jgi:hypothetical protein